jgi:large subunit ribosomal protein L9
MKIILLDDVKTLGKKGAIKEVSEGYARNFLLPKKLAEAATQEAIKDLEIKKEREEKEEKEMLEKMRRICDALQNKLIVIKAKDRKGKLFGSITEKDIAAELEKEGIEIEEKWIKFENSIKKVGNYEVGLEMQKGIKAKIILKVESEGQ